MKNINSAIARLLCFTLSSGIFLCGSCDGLLGLEKENTEEESEDYAIRNAIGVNEAKNRAGSEDIWVSGYVVGGDLTSTKVSFAPPFKSSTCLAIAADSCCVARDSCMSVQLPKGEIRDGLNLPSHPELIGKRIYIKGDVVASYYGLPGVQNPTHFYCGKPM